jgi:enterobacterial common antigen flippase
LSKQADLDRQDSDPHSAAGYGHILKTSTLMGLSTGLNLVLAAVRTKIFAMLLGPSGMGLMGALSSIADLTRNLAGLGLQNSGVRQIARAQAEGDEQRLGVSMHTLLWASAVMAFLGALVLWAGAPWISQWTFGTSNHALAVGVLALAVFFRLIADGQGAVLQGMRCIPSLAKEATVGSVLSVLVGVPWVIFLGHDGIAPALVGVAGVSAAVAWWYGHPWVVPRPRVDRLIWHRETRALVRLGLTFMASGFVVLGAGYAVRLILIRHGSLVEAGLFQSAWALGGLYVGLVLQAMGADFYPRLVGAAKDNVLCNRMVNEQALMGLLLCGVGSLATLTLAPWVLTLFYSAEFSAAAHTLRWICLGMTLKVITWPVGTLIIAKGAQARFLSTDLVWAAVQVGLAAWWIEPLGLEGIGMAFFAAYACQALLLWPMAHRLSGFSWDHAVIKTGVLLAFLMATSFALWRWLPSPWAWTWGGIATVLAAHQSWRHLSRLVAVTSHPTGIKGTVAIHQAISWMRRIAKAPRPPQESAR